LKNHCIRGIIFFVLHTTFCTATHNACIIESSGKVAHEYRNFVALANSAGFHTDFKNFYQLLNGVKFQNCQTIFFFADWSIIRNRKNNLVKNYIKSVEDYVNIGDKNLVLFFPPTINTDTIIDFLRELKVSVPSTLLQSFTSFVINAFVHDINKGKLFGTTLINTTVSRLPNCTTLAPVFHFQDTKLNNTYMIANMSDFTFCEMTENFFANPLDFEFRQQCLLAAQKKLHDFYAFSANKQISVLNQHDSTHLPTKLTQQFNFDRKHVFEKKLNTTLARSHDYSWMVDNQLVCAWLEPDDYFLNEPPGTTPTALDRGMDFLYESGINLAWFEFNPELFLSTFSPTDSQPLIQKITTLHQALRRRFAGGKRQQPKFFVGTDITTNYRAHPVAKATKDFFGNAYSKIPCPLDFEGFWKPELLDVFDRLIEKLPKEVAIDGIFLDFEMYHAQNQASGYTNFMDFSDLSWKLYATRTKNQKLLTLISIESRTTYLAQHRLFDDYFSVLTRQAQAIGQRIRKHITQKLPHALLAVYATTLPASWFYRGIMAGLGTPEQPLILVTFNTDYYAHVAWLEKQGIYVIHGSPIMLSKIEKTADTHIISELLQYQNFVWLNRPSRMIYQPEQRKNMWWASEASPLPATELARAVYKTLHHS
jgi:hypothetical protein